MKITFKNKVRNIAPDTVFDFSILDKSDFITIVGDNGSGKSTVLQALRGYFPAQTESLYEDDNKKLAKDADLVVEHNYEKVFFLDTVKDNGLDFNNAYSATSLISLGGFGKDKISHGEGSLEYMFGFLKKIENQIVPDKTLVVLDEVDKGLSLKNMSLFINFVNKLTVTHKCKVIIVSHNPFFIIQSFVCYDIVNRDFVLSMEYIKEKTGFSMIRSKETTA